MGHADFANIFSSLTEKQHEALALACQHLTSKQIAQELGVAPVTIDKRIDAVRAALVQSTIKLRTIPVDVVRPWLTDRADEPVRAAAYVIGRPRLASGVRALLAVRAHRDEETRQHVARGLARSAAGDSACLDA